MIPRIHQRQVPVECATPHRPAPHRTLNPAAPTPTPYGRPATLRAAGSGGELGDAAAGDAHNGGSVGDGQPFGAQGESGLAPGGGGLLLEGPGAVGGLPGRVDPVEGGYFGDDGDGPVGVVGVLVDGVEVVDDLLAGAVEAGDLGVVVLVDLELPIAGSAGSGDGDGLAHALLLSMARSASRVTFGTVRISPRAGPPSRRRRRTAGRAGPWRPHRVRRRDKRLQDSF